MCPLAHEVHKGSRWTQCYGDLVYLKNPELAQAEERNRPFAVFRTSPLNPKKFPAFLLSSDIWQGEAFRA